MKLTSYITNGGIRVTREIRNHDYQPADTALARSLDERRGVLFSTSFEFPGRYTRWDMGFVDQPLVFTARGRQFSIDALNELRSALTNHSSDHGSCDSSMREESHDDRTITKTARSRAQSRRQLTTGSAKITGTGPGIGRPASGGARWGRR